MREEIFFGANRDEEDDWYFSVCTFTQVKKRFFFKEKQILNGVIVRENCVVERIVGDIYSIELKRLGQSLLKINFENKK